MFRKKSTNKNAETKPEVIEQMSHTFIIVRPQKMGD